MPEQLQKVLKRLMEWWKKFTNKQRMLMISITAVVILALVILSVVVSRPTYTTLIDCENAKEESLVPGEDDSFSSVLAAAMNSVNETNNLQNTAESEEIRFALGESENPHDMLVAETKANVALQYTVAVRDKLVDGYKEIMQMSV